jgi:hypothetical protein
MERLKRAALLTRLVQTLREQGSWSGETHVQKATYFLQELLHVPLHYEFVLYKHGPFSFDLRDELTAMRADELLALEPQAPPYGPKISTTLQSEMIQDLFSNTIQKYSESIAFVAERLANKDVSELERLATAFFVTLRTGLDVSVEKRVENFTRMKPHITPESARAAIRKADQYIEEAKPLVASLH